jgi:hypothetical protein
VGEQLVWNIHHPILLLLEKELIEGPGGIQVHHAWLVVCQPNQRQLQEKRERAIEGRHYL